MTLSVHLLQVLSDFEYSLYSDQKREMINVTRA